MNDCQTCKVNQKIIQELLDQFLKLKEELETLRKTIQREKKQRDIIEHES